MCINKELFDKNNCCGLKTKTKLHIFFPDLQLFKTFLRIVRKKVSANYHLFYHYTMIKTVVLMQNIAQLYEILLIGLCVVKMFFCFF